MLEDLLRLCYLGISGRELKVCARQVTVSISGTRFLKVSPYLGNINSGTLYLRLLQAMTQEAKLRWLTLSVPSPTPERAFSFLFWFLLQLHCLELGYFVKHFLPLPGSHQVSDPSQSPLG